MLCSFPPLGCGTGQHGDGNARAQAKALMAEAVVAEALGRDWGGTGGTGGTGEALEALQGVSTEASKVVRRRKFAVPTEMARALLRCLPCTWHSAPTCRLPLASLRCRRCVVCFVASDLVSCRLLPQASSEWHWDQSHSAARASRVTVNESGGIESFDLCGTFSHFDSRPKVALSRAQQVAARHILLRATFCFEFPVECGADCSRLVDWLVELFRAAGPNPSEDLSDPYLDGFLAHQQLDYGLSGLLMVIMRTDNSNMVVYQVGIGRCCRLLPPAPALHPRTASHEQIGCGAASE